MHAFYHSLSLSLSAMITTTLGRGNRTLVVVSCSTVVPNGVAHLCGVGGPHTPMKLLQKWTPCTKQQNAVVGCLPRQARMKDGTATQRNAFHSIPFHDWMIGVSGSEAGFDSIRACHTQTTACPTRCLVGLVWGHCGIR